jgi:hypothetical protein
MTKQLSILATLFLITTPALAANDGAGSAPAPATKAVPSDRVMRSDANKDQVVDRAEWQAAQKKRFDRLDKNRDGKLSEDELLASGRQSATEQQEKRRSTQFKKADADSDGTVTLDEFIANADPAFTRCDKNQDGRTNSEECGQASKRVR